MMKFCLVLFAVVGLSYAGALHHRQTRNLHDDLQDFLKLIPVDKIKEIALDYLVNDAEVQQALVYLQSDEFEKIVVTVDQQKETTDLLNFLEDSGLAAYDFLNRIHDLLDIPHIPKPSVHRRHSRSIRQLIDDIMALIPVEDVKALYYEKLQTSPDFKRLVDRLSSQEFHDFVLRMKNMPEVQELVQKLRDHGIDVDAIVELIKKLFGWERRSVRSTRNLHDDLQDFLKLIPVDKIKEIALDYLVNDAEVQQALVYLQSDEFEKIVVTVDQQKETTDLLNFLEDSGLAAYDFLNRIHDLLDIPHIPKPSVHRRHSRSIRQLIDDIMALIPVEDVKALYYEKLQTSPDFKRLVDRLSSQEFHDFVLRMKNMPEVQELVQKLRDHGIDVDAIVELIKKLFGWERRSVRSTRNLHDDLQDFLKLIPVDKIKEIALDYLVNDAEVQQALVYLQSDEFEKIVVTVDQQKETTDLLNFLEDSGLAAYDFLNRIHDLLDIPHIPKPSVHRRHSRSIRQLIDDIMALIPVEDVKALYYEKLQTSPDFKRLVDRLSSQEFHDFVLRMKNMPEVQELVQKLRDHGIDVDAIVELIKKLFGWERRSVRSTRNLHDDLQDFLKLIPVDKIKEIALDYLVNDAEVQQALVYLQSDEFEKIVVTVDQQKETTDLLNFLEDSGLAAYDFLNRIHDLLDIPHIPKPSVHRRHSRSIRQLIDDIMALIPVEDVKALYYEKLQTSPDFKRLVDRLSSQEFHDFVLRMKNMPEVQELVQKLRDHGIDVDAIVELIKKLFGWERRSVRSTRNLHDDLQDFLKLIPVDKIKEIALDYLVNDAEVQQALVYLQSDEFEKIVVTVDQQKETTDLLNFLEDSGLAAYDFLNRIHDLLDIPHIPKPSVHRRHSRSIRQLIDDIMALIPVEDVKALYYEKLQTSPDFKRLVDRLSSQEFHDFVLRMKNMPEVQELVQKLRDHGIDVDAIVELIKKLFGWERRSLRDIHDDI